MTRERRALIFRVAALHGAVFVAIFLLTFARVNDRIAPFAIAFLFACFCLKVNKLSVCVAAFLCALFTHSGQSQILAVALSCGVFVLFAYILPVVWGRYRDARWFKRFHAEVVLLFVGYALSQVVEIAFAAGGGNATALFLSLISLAIGFVFLGACLVFINAAKVRGSRIPWTLDQKISIGVFATVLSLGLGGFDCEWFFIHKFFAVFIIVLVATTFKTQAAFMAAACFGLGLTLKNLDLVPIAAYVLIALAAVAFKSPSRLPSLIAVMCTDAVLGFYFRAYFGYGLYDVLPLAAGCFLVLVVPRALGRRFDFSGGILGGYLVSKNQINRNRAGAYRRLENLSNVFNEMQNVYKGLVRGGAGAEDNARLCARELAFTLCENCPKRPTCRRDTNASEEIDEAFLTLCRTGLARGNVTFLDMPPAVSLKCGKINAALSGVNSIVGQVQTVEKTAGQMDGGKVVMANLLSGLATLCRHLAADLGAGVVFDIEKAQEIKDALLRGGVATSDCLISRTQSEYVTSVLVPRSEAYNVVIEKAVSRAIGCQMQVDTIDDADTAGFSIVTLKTAPRYALTFGVAQVAKDFNPNNGDSYGFLKVTNEKTMMSICDGMGAGDRAKRASTLAISLIENFYKAGFSHETIMENVNQLLIMTNQEAFSAIDVAVFSLSDGRVSFIKVGGVEGFIKRASEVEVVEAGSLPMGIVEEMAPKITRAHLNAGDMVVLVSDGVTESFKDKVALGNFINNTRTDIPQQIADEIIHECLNRTNRLPIDDTTVLVAKIYESTK